MIAQLEESLGVSATGPVEDALSAIAEGKSTYRRSFEALNRQLGEEVFHPSRLVNFRNRLEEHQQSALGFQTILTALEQAGLVSLPKYRSGRPQRNKTEGLL